MLKRFIDLLISSIFLILFFYLFVLIALIIKLTSKGPAIYWSKREGRNGKFFMMPKFRTMIIDTPELPKSKLLYPEKYLTKFGKILRATSLDELPQFISVLQGNMSVVGPRPGLYNQNELLRKRHSLGIDKLTPGITGWAQVNGRDKLSLNEKIKFDYEYLERKSLRFDLYIILLTFWVVIRSKDFSH